MFARWVTRGLLFVGMVASASGCGVGEVDFCAHVASDIQLHRVFDSWPQIMCIDLETEVLEACRTRFGIIGITLGPLFWMFS